MLQIKSPFLLPIFFLLKYHFQPNNFSLLNVKSKILKFNSILIKLLAILFLKDLLNTTLVEKKMNSRLVKLKFMSAYLNYY